MCTIYGRGPPNCSLSLSVPWPACDIVSLEARCPFPHLLDGAGLLLNCRRVCAGCGSKREHKRGAMDGERVGGAGGFV